MDNGKATIIAAIIAAVATIIAAVIGVTMQKQNTELQEVNSSLQAKNVESNSEISGLRDRISELETTISTLRTTNSESEGENSTLQSENADLYSQISDLESEISTLQNEKSLLETRISELTAEILSLQGNAVPMGDGYNFLSVCAPYQSKYYNAPTTDSIAGQKHSNLFYIERHGSTLGYAYYNLDGRYKSLTFYVGHRDGMEMETGSYNFYLDGNLERSIDLTPEMMPKPYSIDLHYAQQMKIEGAEGWPESYALFDVIIS